MNKIILISGASSGIGKAAAEFFYNQGNTVIGLSRTLPQFEYDYDYYIADLSDSKSVDKAVNEVIEKYGYIDVLINCAGIGISGAIEYNTIEEVRKIFDVNVIGQFNLIKKFIPFLRESKRGKIINIGSVAGELTIPFQTFYSMTKAAMHKFTEGLKIELKPFNIDVCTILPGDTKTGFTKNRYLPTILENDLYKDRIKKSIQRMEKDEQNGRSPLSVVKVIDKVIKRKKMPIHVTVGMEYKFLVFLGKILPKRLANWIISKMYG